MQHSDDHLFRFRSNYYNVTLSQSCVRFTWLVGLPRTSKKVPGSRLRWEEIGLLKKKTGRRWFQILQSILCSKITLGGLHKWSILEVLVTSEPQFDLCAVPQRSVTPLPPSTGSELQHCRTGLIVCSFESPWRNKQTLDEPNCCIDNTFEIFMGRWTTITPILFFVCIFQNIGSRVL